MIQRFIDAINMNAHGSTAVIHFCKKVSLNFRDLHLWAYLSVEQVLGALLCQTRFSPKGKTKEGAGGVLI